jgi:hypothetical protein
MILCLWYHLFAHFYKVAACKAVVHWIICLYCMRARPPFAKGRGVEEGDEWFACQPQGKKIWPTGLGCSATPPALMLLGPSTPLPPTTLTQWRRPDAHPAAALLFRTPPPNPSSSVKIWMRRGSRDRSARAQPLRSSTYSAPLLQQDMAYWSTILPKVTHGQKNIRQQS